MWGAILRALRLIFSPWLLERRLASLERGQREANKVTNGLLGLVGLVINLLHKRATLSPEELHSVLRSYSEMARLPEVSPNPLTREEHDRLNGYLAKVRRGDFFSAAEVTDYNSIVSKLQQEKNDDPEVWPLVALGAFLFGLFGAALASRKD